MAVVQTSKIQVRVGKIEDLPVLSTGEFGYATDTNQLFIGNPNASLPTDNTEIITSKNPLSIIGQSNEVLFNNYGTTMSGSSKFKYESINSVLTLKGTLIVEDLESLDKGTIRYTEDNLFLLSSNNSSIQINKDTTKGIELLVNSAKIVDILSSGINVKTNTDTRLKITSLTDLGGSGEGVGIDSVAIASNTSQPLTIRGSEIKLKTSTTDIVTVSSTGLNVNGTFTATTKNFYINHPTKENMHLVHGSLEGPENGVYVRGKCTDHFIKLPDYWIGLVDEASITVTLTPIGKFQKLYVEKILENVVFIGCDDIKSSKEILCYYHIWAERKDVPKLQVEV